MKSVEVVAQAHLQTFPDVIQRTIDCDLKVLSCGLRKMFELSSGEPRWDVLHCKLSSVGELTFSVTRTNRKRVDQESTWNCYRLERM